jgi:hypothetical protein
MKPRSKNRKLVLARDVLRRLTPEALAHVVGGQTGPDPDPDPNPDPNTTGLTTSLVSASCSCPIGPTEDVSVALPALLK